MDFRCREGLCQFLLNGGNFGPRLRRVANAAIFEFLGPPDGVSHQRIEGVSLHRDFTPRTSVGAPPCHNDSCRPGLDTQFLPEETIAVRRILRILKAIGASNSPGRYSLQLQNTVRRDTLECLKVSRDGKRTDTSATV